MCFVNGHIEFLDKAGIKDSSVDIIISNCVVNLSPDKRRVLSEAYRVLAPGGEMYFSDVYSDRRMSPEAQQHKVIGTHWLFSISVCRRYSIDTPAQILWQEAP